MNSLLIAPQWIGDAVMTEPLLRRLHARGERITVGALPWVAPVYRAMPQVAQVLEFPFAHGGLQWRARREWAKRLRGQFDKAYVCPNSLKSALLPWWADIPTRIGYLGESRYGLLNQRLSNPPKGERPPMVAFYSALSGAADAEIQTDKPALNLPLAPIQSALAAMNLVANAYYVFAPGAEYGSAKRWPAHHFADLAAHLPLPVVLLGSGKEAALCQEIADAANAAGGHCYNWAGKTTLDQALAAIAAAKAMVSNDSGLMHVAAAFGVPQVAIFGSSSPLHTPPLNDKAHILWLKLECAPCFQRECPLSGERHTQCLEKIQPAQVLRFIPLPPNS